MQAHKNPFVTGDGVTPPKLAGRDGVLRDVTISYQRALEGIPPRSFMFIGLRGVVYSTQLGYIDFTIPLFAKYLNGTLLEAKV